MDSVQKVGAKWVAETTIDGETVQSPPLRTKTDGQTWITNRHFDAKFGNEGERLMSAAIIKGLVEHQDGRRFFGSTMNYTHHFENAVSRGYVMPDKSLTPMAMDWYERHLAALPQSRQVFWKSDQIGIPQADSDPAPAAPNSAEPNGF